MYILTYFLLFLPFKHYVYTYILSFIFNLVYFFLVLAIPPISSHLHIYVSTLPPFLSPILSLSYLHIYILFIFSLKLLFILSISIFYLFFYLLYYLPPTFLRSILIPIFLSSLLFIHLIHIKFSIFELLSITYLH